MLLKHNIFRDKKKLKVTPRPLINYGITLWISTSKIMRINAQNPALRYIYNKPIL